jgi:hypothetical protein
MSAQVHMARLESSTPVPALTPTGAFTALFGPQPIAGAEIADERDPMDVDVPAPMVPPIVADRPALVSSRDRATQLRMQSLWAILYHELAPTAEGFIATSRTVPPQLSSDYQSYRTTHKDLPDLDTLLSSHDQLLAVSTVTRVLVESGRTPDEVTQWFASGNRSSRVWLDVIAQRAKGVGSTPLYQFLEMIAGHRGPKTTASSLLNDEIAQQLRAAQAQVAARLRQDMSNLSQQIGQLNTALSVELANINAAQIATDVLHDFYPPAFGHTNLDAAVALGEAVKRCKSRKKSAALLDLFTKGGTALRSDLGNALIVAPLWLLYTLGTCRAAALAITSNGGTAVQLLPSVTQNAKNASRKQIDADRQIESDIDDIASKQIDSQGNESPTFQRLTADILMRLRDFGLGDKEGDDTYARSIRAELGSTLASIAGAFSVDPEYEDANLYKLLNVELFFQPERIEYFTAWALIRYRDRIFNDYTQLAVDPRLRDRTIPGQLSHIAPSPAAIGITYDNRVDVDRLGIAPFMPVLLPRVSKIGAASLFQRPMLWIPDPKWGEAYNAEIVLRAQPGTDRQLDTRTPYYLDDARAGERSLPEFDKRVQSAVQTRNTQRNQAPVAAAPPAPPPPAAAPAKGRVVGRTFYDVVSDASSAVRSGVGFLGGAAAGFIDGLRRITPSTIVAGESRGDLLTYEPVLKDGPTLRDYRIAFANQASFLEYFVQRILADPTPALDEASGGDVNTSRRRGTFPIVPPASSLDQLMSVRPDGVPGAAAGISSTSVAVGPQTSAAVPTPPGPLDWLNAQISALRDALGLGSKAGAGSVGLIFDNLPDVALLRPGPSAAAGVPERQLATVRAQGLAELVAYWGSGSGDLVRAKAASKAVQGIEYNKLSSYVPDQTWPWDPNSALLLLATQESYAFDIVRTATEELGMNTFCDATLELEKLAVANRLVRSVLELFIDMARGVHETRRRRVQGLVSATSLSAASLRTIGAYADSANRGSAGAPEFEMLPYINGQFWLAPSVISAMQKAEEEIKQRCQDRTVYKEWKQNGIDKISIQDIAMDGRPEAADIRGRMAQLVALFMHRTTGSAGWIQTKEGRMDLVQQEKRIYLDLFNFRWNPRLRTLVRGEVKLRR